jgi:hypothetical protein
VRTLACALIYQCLKAGRQQGGRLKTRRSQQLMALEFGVRQLAAAFKSLNIRRSWPKAQASLRTADALSKFE